MSPERWTPDMPETSPAPMIAPTPAGPVVVQLPDRVSAPQWSSLAKLWVDEKSGYPMGVALPGPGASCRCGQAAMSELRIRHCDSKVLCADCSQRPLPVGVGEPVAFRLVDSDLYQYLGDLAGADRVVMRGVVESVSQHYQEVSVRVDGWAVPHAVDVTALVERPARLDDMRRFWPGKTDEELQQAYAAVMNVGGLLTVSTCGMADEVNGDG